LKTVFSIDLWLSTIDSTNKAVGRSACS